MIAGEFDTVRAARDLIAYSDARDREQAARLAFGAEQYAAGIEAGDRQGAERVHAWYAGERRELAAAVGEALARQAPADAEGRRWHVCCAECRRGGCRAGCPRCEARDRATFGDPHPGDYLGGPLLEAAA